jgi:hypothetical protein
MVSQRIQEGSYYAGIGTSATSFVKRLKQRLGNPIDVFSWLGADPVPRLGCHGCLEGVNSRRWVNLGLERSEISLLERREQGCPVVREEAIERYD